MGSAGEQDREIMTSAVVPKRRGTSCYHDAPCRPSQPKELHRISTSYPQMHLVLASQHLITLITVITPIIIIIVGFISTFPQLSYSDLCNTSFSFAFSALHTQNHLQHPGQTVVVLLPSCKMQMTRHYLRKTQEQQH